jgi:hypothetical protein
MTSVRILLLVAAFCATFSAPCWPAGAQQPVSPDEVRKMCETMLCRQSKVVRLKLDNGKLFEKKFEAPWPIADKGWVSVFPDETVFVEAEVSGDHLTNFRAVKVNDHPEKTLEFELSQEAESPAMTLVVTNPFKRTVKYHATMMLPTGEKLLKTSTCPVMGGGRMAFESWPNAIFQLVLFDFRLLDEDAGQMACEF